MLSTHTYFDSKTTACCGAQIDCNHYVDIDLRAYPLYTGPCRITIRASDGIKTADSSFYLDIRQVLGRSNLPIIIKGAGGSSGADDIIALPELRSQTNVESVMNAYPVPMGTTIENKQSLQDTEIPNPYPLPQP